MEEPVPDMQGVVAIAADGSHVYFVAKSVLTGGTRMIVGMRREGRLETGERHLGGAGDADPWRVWVSRRSGSGWGRAGSKRLHSRSSGDWLVIMSGRSLTGYDNREVRSDEADEEVFEFGVQSGTVTCVSCNTTGAPRLRASNAMVGAVLTPICRSASS